MSPSIGSLLHKRYRLTETIGEGGSGSVFKAVDTRTGLRVAIKLAHARAVSMGAESADVLLQRFVREAKVLARLEHPNTVQLLDFGTDNDTWFLVMEYLDGLTLQTFMRQIGRVPEPTALAIAVRIGRSLQQAHEIGVLHRDIKPANVVLVPGHDSTFLVKVLDFGLVKFFMSHEEHSLTEQDKFVGTPAYLAPECIGPNNVGVGADLYSLGIVMYEMLSGRLPFRERNPVKQVLAHHQQPPPPLLEVAGPSQITEETASIVMRCLAKRPEQRWASAEDLVRQLEAQLRVLEQPVPPCEATLAPALSAARRNQDQAAFNDAPTILMDPSEDPGMPGPKGVP